MIPIFRSKDSRKKGSALLLTLLVVSLLMVIVLTFTVFVRMELRQVVLRQQRMQAQANARLAANMAIGRLQETLGPDARVSAAGGLWGDASAPNELDNSVLIQNGNRFWTGAWARDPLDPANRLFLGWLLSGEDTTRDELSDAASAPVGVPLLAGGSVVDPATEGVAAPTVEIDSGPDGRFAWWVGDEGVKARMDLTDAFAVDGDSSTDAWRTWSAQRHAPEVLDPSLNPADPAVLLRQRKLESRPQLDFFFNDPTLPKQFFHDVTLTSQGLLTNTRYGGLKGDLTAVLEESWNNNGAIGGPQWDQLMAHSQLRMDRLEAEGRIRPDQNAAHYQAKIFPPMSSLPVEDDTGGPTWNQLVSWSTMTQRSGNTVSAVAPDHSTEAQKGLSPVIARFQLLRYTSFHEDLDPNRGGAGSTATARFHYVPCVVLWNPYNIDLADSSYYVSSYVPDLSGQNLEYSMDNVELTYRHVNPADPSDPLIDNTYTTEVFTQLRAENAQTYSHLIFRTDSVSIRAGEAKIFTLSSPTLMPVDPADLYGGNRFFVVPDTGISEDPLTPGNTSTAVAERVIPLAEGWNDFGLNSFYVEVDLAQWTASQSVPFNPALHVLDEVVAAFDHIGQPTSSHFLQVSTEFDDLFRGDSNDGGSGFAFQSSRALEDQPLSLLFRMDYTLEGNHWNYRVVLFDEADAFFPGHSEPFPTFGSAQSPYYGLSWMLRLPHSKAQVSAGDYYGLDRDSGMTAYQEMQRNAPVPFFSLINPKAGFQAPTPSFYHQRGTNYRQTPNYHGGFRFTPSTFVVENYGDEIGFVGFNETPPAGTDSRSILSEVPRSLEEVLNPASLQSADLSSVTTYTAAGSIHEEGFQYLYDEDKMLTNTGGSLWHSSNAAPNLSTGIPLGNSFAPMLVAPDTAYRDEWWNWVDAGSTSFPPDTVLYDTSYLLNEALWDDFFFSSEANSRLTESGTPRDFAESAVDRRIEGALNVNSTSVEAWRTLLYAMNGLEMENQIGEPERNTGETLPLSRFIEPLSRSFSPAAGDPVESLENFAGGRRLTPAEADRLADAIVEQVRIRGPFLSMADFVNRSLRPATGDSQDLRLRGALQAAIEAAGLNASQIDSDPDSEILATEFLGDADPDAGDASNTWLHFELDAIEGAALKGVPGFLTQADVLARIGGVLQARSDTFVIRAYGEVGDAGSPNARAWCEVVVQRQSDYVDPADPPEQMPENLTAPANTAFGRTFRVVSFKWLNQDEI